ncbi:MAG: hypothetical protein RLZZ449_932 [Actinomycetota bacterium]
MLGAMVNSLRVWRVLPMSTVELLQPLSQRLPPGCLPGSARWKRAELGLSTLLTERLQKCDASRGRRHGRTRCVVAIPLSTYSPVPAICEIPVSLMRWWRVGSQISARSNAPLTTTRELKVSPAYSRSFSSMLIRP